MKQPIYVWVSIEDKVVTVGDAYATKELAQEAFKDFLGDKEEWENDDFKGRSYEECLEQMEYVCDGGESQYFMQITDLVGDGAMTYE